MGVSGKWDDLEQEDWLDLSNLRSLTVPSILYECLLRKIHTLEPDPPKNTTKYQKHELMSCYVECGEYKPLVVYRGPNVTEMFIEKLSRGYGGNHVVYIVTPNSWN